VPARRTGPEHHTPRFYNAGMHTFRALPRLATLFCALAASAAMAQQPAPKTEEKAQPEQKIERIHHEDAGSRIDELRVGGETKNITVDTKGKAPAYEVTPASNNRNPSSADGSAEGKTRWNLFKY
jgi:hypothetical protein